MYRYRKKQHGIQQTVGGPMYLVVYFRIFAIARPVPSGKTKELLEFDMRRIRIQHEF